MSVDIFPPLSEFPELSQPQWAQRRREHYERICGGKGEIGICDGCGERKVVFPFNVAPLVGGSICISCLESRRDERNEEEDHGYDLAEYIAAPPLKRLSMLREAWSRAASDRQRAFYEGQMAGLTVDLDEHPKDFEHGCLCALCRS